MKRTPIAPSVASTRARALEAAGGLLREGGVEAVQLRTIAARVGSGVATLYHHFSDKDALLAALTLEGFHQLVADMETALRDARFPRPIDAVSYAYLRFMRKNMHLHALMRSGEMHAAHPDVRQAEQEAFKVFRRGVQADPRVPEVRVDEVALVCWVLGRGIADVLQAAAEPGGEAPDLIVEQVLSGFSFLLSDEFSSRPR
ncbi:TetR/AcrR family transcriptional regulator [Phenylobacterium sp.]|uniref:TetR/AcrR family transcriptional regulator n=1 Tax=Phenylobacterium sp. TaxID=1871053 RepID=UPI0028998235|nr:TetR/AcrR family transcriptional regulator [Phenylobacterium sp.]